MFWKASLLATFLLGFHLFGNAQCSLNPSATPGLTLTHVSTNCLNNSGVAFNPIDQLYYACRAGNTGFPLETWDAVGTPLYQTTTGFDYRGMWWNPTLSQMEANGYSSYGIWSANLNASGYALNTGTNIFSANQPNSQSCGDLDYDDYEIIYYYNGGVYRFNRVNNAFLGTTVLTGMPVATSNLNWTTVFYTGCLGMEYGVLDYVNKRVYLFNKATGAYTGMSQLPAAAVTSNGFRCSWANGMLWLFDLSSRTWTSYDIFAVALNAGTVQLTAERNQGGPALLNWEVEFPNEVSEMLVERSLDGLEFEPVSELSDFGQGKSDFAYPDYQVPTADQVYYRIQTTDHNGTVGHSNIAMLRLTEEAAIQAVIFPNPSNGQFFVTIHETAAAPGILTLVDAFGREVGQQPISLESGRNQLKWEDEGLASGLYFLSLEQQGRHLSLGKVIIQ